MDARDGSLFHENEYGSRLPLQPLLENFPLQENWFRAFIAKRKYRLARIQALVNWLVADLDGFAAAAVVV